MDVKLLPEDARRALYGHRTIWMTPYPQIKRYLHHIVGEKLRNIKVREYTGLYVAVKNKIPEQYAVEMWVSPHDLIRPCPNPDVIEQVCIPSAPYVHPTPASYKDVFSYLRRSDQLTYEFWFKSNTEFTYIGQNPFPWTRMGYSYNWDPTTRNHHGASEFILRPGATVQVHEVIDLKNY